MLGAYIHYPMLQLNENNESVVSDAEAVKEFHWLYEGGIYYATKDSISYCPFLINFESGKCVDKCADTEVFYDGICFPNSKPCLNGYYLLDKETDIAKKACVRECPLD